MNVSTAVAAILSGELLNSRAISSEELPSRRRRTVHSWTQSVLMWRSPGGFCEPAFALKNLVDARRVDKRQRNAILLRISSAAPFVSSAPDLLSLGNAQRPGHHPFVH